MRVSPQTLNPKGQHHLNQPPPYLSNNRIIIKGVIKQAQLDSQCALTEQHQHYAEIPAAGVPEPVVHRTACGINKDKVLQSRVK